MTEKTEYEQGWYDHNGERYLTLTALQKEVKDTYGLTKRELAKILLSTHYGYPHQGELRIATRINPHNGKRFDITCLVDVEMLIEAEQSKNFSDLR